MVKLKYFNKSIAKDLMMQNSRIRRNGMEENPSPLIAQYQPKKMEERVRVSRKISSIVS
jgi:hypothetical protein